MVKMRELDSVTLTNAAKYLAGQWFAATSFSTTVKDLPVGGKGLVLRNMHNATFKDEFNFLYTRFLGQIGDDAKREFAEETGDLFTPRDDAVLEKMLSDKLGINPAGEHIKGVIGTTSFGDRFVGMHVVEVETPESLKHRRLNGLDKSHRETYGKIVRKYEPILAGMVEEHGYSSIVDFMRDTSGALNTNISEESARLGLDAWADLLDEGSNPAIGEGRSTPQRVDPDAAAAGTLLFSLLATDPMFQASTDQGDGTVDAVASSIADDTSADATATLLWMRWAATNDSITPLDDHLDGECAAGGGADYNFNTLSIVAGAVVSMSALTVTQGQGPSAT